MSYKILCDDSNLIVSNGLEYIDDNQIFTATNFAYNDFLPAFYSKNSLKIFASNASNVTEKVDSVITRHYGLNNQSNNITFINHPENIVKSADVKTSIHYSREDPLGSSYSNNPNNDFVNVTCTMNLPSDVKANISSGVNKFSSSSGIVLSLTGTLNKGDTIVVKRSSKTVNATVQNNYQGGVTYLGVGDTTILDVTVTHAIIVPTTIKYTDSLVNCSSDVPSGSYVRRDIKNITLTSKNIHYNFNDPIKLTIYNEQPNHDNNYTFKGNGSHIETLNLPKFSDSTTGFKIQANALIQPVILNEKLTNCTTEFTNSKLVPRGKTSITLTATKGYIFDKGGKITLYDNKELLSNEYVTIDPNNKNILTVTIPPVSDTCSSISITMSATPEKISSNGLYLNLYSVTISELSELSKKAFYTLSGSSVTALDVTDYIKELVSIPFNIPSDMLANSTILLGSEKTDVTTQEINDTRFNVSLGSISVPEKYKNGYDYNSTKAVLYLPFMTPITLDIHTVINKTITINYDIDISTGETVIYLSNGLDQFDNVIQKISTNLPFLDSGYRKVVTNFSSLYDNKIRQPYIIVTRNIPILNANYYPTNEKGLLKNYNGNVKASLLNNVNINNNELNALQNLLENGVNIK